MRGRWRGAAAVAVVVLSLAACAKEKAGPPVVGATVPTALLFPTTTTTDPYAIPPTIDAAYVNRVLAGLDAAFGDTFRLMVTTKSVPLEVLDRMKAIYGDRDLLNLQLDAMQTDLVQGGARLPANPGNKQTTASKLLIAASACIYAEVERNYSEFARRTIPPRHEWIALKPLDRNADPNRYNATGWSYIYEGFNQNFQAPGTPPCGA